MKLLLLSVVNNDVSLILYIIDICCIYLVCKVQNAIETKCNIQQHPSIQQLTFHVKCMLHLTIKTHQFTFKK